MTANNVYNLSRALTGLYPLRTFFKDQAVKLYDVRVFSGTPEVIPEQIEPGNIFYFLIAF